MRSLDKTQMDNLSAIHYAKEEGLAEGLEKGKQEGLSEGKYEKAIETANRMLADGLSIDIVSKYTGLSEEVLSNI